MDSSTRNSSDCCETKDQLQAIVSTSVSDSIKSSHHPKRFIGRKNRIKTERTTSESKTFSR
jgi:hypothetical protein